MTLKLGIRHWVLKNYQVYSNDAPGLSLTYFTARSNLVPYAFVWENVKTMDFSETIVVYDVKIGRCSQPNESFYEYQMSMSFIDRGPDNSDSLFFNFFSSITADLNITAALRWAIQNQWSSGLKDLPLSPHLLAWLFSKWAKWSWQAVKAKLKRKYTWAFNRHVNFVTIKMLVKRSLTNDDIILSCHCLSWKRLLQAKCKCEF